MTAFIYEIAGWAGNASRSRSWAEDELVPSLQAASGVTADLYLPVECRFSDASPDFIVTLGFSSLPQAREVLSAPEFQSVLDKNSRELKLKGEFMRVHAFPIDGAVAEGITARFSFVVRYFLPADDVAEFQTYYMTMHPPILAEFEGIRNIFCYTPEEPEGAPLLPRAGYLIGNEVAFDSLAAFERAMASPVAEKSKADARTFPPYSGRNPHFAMERTRLRDARR